MAQQEDDSSDDYQYDVVTKNRYKNTNKKIIK